MFYLTLNAEQNRQEEIIVTDKFKSVLHVQVRMFLVYIYKI